MSGAGPFNHVWPWGATISGTGMCVPDRVVTNDDLSKLVETSDEWIRPRTGIVTRCIADDGTHTSDLAAEAIKGALKSAGLAAGDLDLVIVATMTPDMICPATACRVVDKLGAVPCGAMDINLACTGYVAALNLAASQVLVGAAKHVAIVGADTLSKVVNWKDRRTCILFGDGAGASIISRVEDASRTCIYQRLQSDGARGDALYVPRDELDLPKGMDPKNTEDPGWNGEFDTLQMKGADVFKFAVTALRQGVEDALKATGLTAEQVKMVIPHQSNVRIMEAAWKRLGFGNDKIHVNIDRFGNTSAASVGICLHELWEAGKVGEGDTVIFVAQGGGLTWGTSVWRL